MSKVLYVGNFSTDSPGEPEIASCLEQLGYQVERMDESHFSVQDVETQLQKEKYDFFLFAKLRIKGNVEDKLKLIKIIPSVCWVFDIYFGMCDETT